MAKRGRSLELIISSLEKLLSNSDIEIKSPDKLYDKNINDHREVDISIKGKIGSHKILIIIECKDFNIPLNIIHIEQLKTKRDALNANKLIVVSKNGFSKNATEFAKKHGIEIRKLSEINENIIENWISRIEFIDISNNYTVNKIIFKLAEKNNLDYMDQSFDNIKLIENVGKGKLNDRDEIFLDKEFNKKFSVFNLLVAIDGQNNGIFTNQVKPNQGPKIFKIHLEFREPSNLLFVQLEKQIYRVIFLDIEFSLSKIKNTIPISKAFRYEKNNEILAEIAQYKLKIANGKKATFTIQKEKKGKKGNFILNFD